MIILAVIFLFESAYVLIWVWLRMNEGKGQMEDYSQPITIRGNISLELVKIAIAEINSFMSKNPEYYLIQQKRMIYDSQRNARIVTSYTLNKEESNHEQSETAPTQDAKQATRGQNKSGGQKAKEI